MAKRSKRKEDVMTFQAKLFFVSGQEGIERVVESAFYEPEWGGTRCFASLTEALAHRQADTAVVVTFPSPLLWLASRMEQGISPSRALADWQEATAPLLEACRVVRRHIALVDREVLLGRPEQIRTAVATRFGLQVETAPGEAGPLTFDAESPLHLMLAFALLRTDEETTSLVDELEAMTVGPVTGTTLSGSVLDAAAEILRETMRERDEHKFKFIAVSQALEQSRKEVENEQKRIQLADQLFSLMLVEGQALHEEADAAERDRAEAIARFESALRAERERASQAQSALIEECKRLRETLFEAEVLALVLGRHEKQLTERLGELIAQHEQERVHLERMLQEARDEVRMLRSSTSWRVTEPIRNVGRRLKKRAASLE